MSHFSSNNKIIRIVSAVIISALLNQAVAPAIVYATETPVANTLETIQSLIDVFPTDESTVIETGDAVAGLTTESFVNGVDIRTSSSTGSTTPDTNLSPEKTLEDDISPTPDTSPTEVIASSSATTTTEAVATATTGHNTGGGQSVTIETGDAIAYTDVLNVVNTTITDSTGLVRFINDTLGYTNFDLRSDFDLTYADFDTPASTAPCAENLCTGNTAITTNNTATIDNDVTVVAGTGSNTAVGGDTDITTGNAYASANIINVANTNITDSQYLLLVFNNFSDYAGDIVLPNSAFFNQFFGGTTAITGTANSTNNANITNDAVVIADTGNNTATGESVITTGSATADNLIHNTVNQTIVSGESFTMLIRVLGDWTGSISGLPDGMTWHETERGIEITSAGSGAGSSNSTVTSTNQATITNNVQVYALTGDNYADGDDGSIKTGNAYANSSILNIANSNIIGSNWSNLIFTIYGNWSGNLAFGQPDLWIGTRATSPDQPIMAGSPVSYTFTIFNHGDTTARGVTLENLFEGTSLDFVGQPDGYAQWDVGDIPAGATREITYQAQVSSLINDSVVSALPLTARVSSQDHDGDMSDNEETVTIYVGEKNTREPSHGTTFPSHFNITKTADTNTTKTGDVVAYTITLFNRGGQLYDALLVDSLENEDGEMLLTQSWPLGEIKNWETITIEYSIAFDEKFPAGTYTNSAQLVGFDSSRKTKYQIPYESQIVTYSVRHNLPPEGQVLGISTSQCTPHLSSYLRHDAANNPDEVSRLQSFLAEHLNINLPVTGYFGDLTEQAVRTFQKMYQEDVLEPWGLSTDTGIVYYTTQKKINEIACEGTRSFPFTTDQENELQQYRLGR